MGQFPLGQIVATPGALAALATTGTSAVSLIQRHARLEQGALDDEDHQANKDALVYGTRVFSSYKAEGAEETFWVIT